MCLEQVHWHHGWSMYRWLLREVVMDLTSEEVAVLTGAEFAWSQQSNTEYESWDCVPKFSCTYCVREAWSLYCDLALSCLCL